jgi:hypothetical protein
MFGLFKKNMIILRVNDKCRPIARGEFYEEPLEELLEEKKIGELTGVGTALRENNDPWYCDIEFSVKDASEPAIQELKNGIEQIGIPKGSQLILEDGQKIPLGTLEGVVVNLNYSTAPESILDATDFQTLWDGVAKSVEPHGQYHDDLNRNGATTIFYYGNAAQTIINSVKAQLQGHALEQYFDVLALPLAIEE